MLEWVPITVSILKMSELFANVRDTIPCYPFLPSISIANTNDITHPCGTHCVRLVDDVAGTYNGSQGRVEILYNGEWGTVCDPYWGIRDAEVVCRQLGYSYALNATRDAYFGQGTGEIYIALVDCRGNETELAYCPSLPLGDVFYCAHPDDAGVVCSSKLHNNAIV